jgi:hypothetical protein
VRLPDGTWSTPFPKSYGHGDDLTKAEKKERDARARVEAPRDIQEIFDIMLQQLAARGGWKSSAEYVAGAFGGVVYDFTLNYLGGHTVNHSDEPNADGPGMWIFNLALMGNGLLFFKQDEMRPDGSWPDMPAAAVYHREGDCIGFTDDARLLMHHAVIKQLPFKELPSISTLVCAGDSAMSMSANYENMRVLASIRGGLVGPKAMGDWWDQFGTSYGPAARPAQATDRPVHSHTPIHTAIHTPTHPYTRHRQPHHSRRHRAAATVPRPNAPHRQLR